MISSGLFAQPWFWWGLVSIIGFPILLVMVDELIQHRVGERQHLARALRMLRNLLIPGMVVLVYLQFVLNDASTSVPAKVVLTLVWIVGISVALSFLNALMFGSASQETWRGRTPKLIIDLSRFGLIIVGSALAFSTVWGASLQGFVAALGVSSLIIGLALQNTLSSLMSGIALLFDRPFTVGDWILLDGVNGEVIDVNWRTVRLMNIDGDVYVFPNLVFGQKELMNRQITPNIVERIDLGFSWDDPPNRVKQILKNVALNTPGVLHEPEPVILVKDYTERAIMYQAVLTIEEYPQMPKARSEFMTRVWYAIQRNQLTVPFPVRKNISLSDEEIDHVATAVQENGGVVPSFGSEGRDLRDLTTDTYVRRFAQGEQMVFEGEEDNELLLVLVGQTVARTRVVRGGEEDVFTIGPGEFVGAGSVMAGGAAPYGVTALTDVSCVVLETKAVRSLTLRDPGFSKELAAVFKSRREACLLVKNAPPEAIELHEDSLTQSEGVGAG